VVLTHRLWTQVCVPTWRRQYAHWLTFHGHTTEALQQQHIVIRTDGDESQHDQYHHRERLCELLLHDNKVKDARGILLRLLADPAVRDSPHASALGGRLLSRLLAADDHLYGAPSAELEQARTHFLGAAHPMANGYKGWGHGASAALTTITRVPTSARMEQLVAARQPAKLAPKGGLDAFGLRSLPPDLLASRAGDEPVVVEAARAAHRGPSARSTSSSPLFGFLAPHTRRVRCSFAALIADVFGKANAADAESCRNRLPPPADAWRMYMNLFDEVPEVPGSAPYHRPSHRFTEELPLPTFVPREQIVKVSLWIGHSGYMSALHSDPTDNLYVVLRGRKRFRVYPPFEVAHAHAHPPVSAVSAAGVTTQEPRMGASYSLLRTTDPGVSPYPREAAALRARGHVVEVETGEALYLPARWLHEVDSADDGGGHVSVNYWWRAEGSSDGVRNLDELTLRWNRSVAAPLHEASADDDDADGAFGYSAVRSRSRDEL
jgi:hypothetical protein